MDILSEVEKITNNVKTRKDIEDMVNKVLSLERENQYLNELLKNARRGSGIECPTQRLIISELQKFKHQHDAKVDDVLKVSMKQFVIVEELEPVEDFFERKMDQYKNSRKVGWYKCAEKDFLRVFSDVANAMLWLYTSGFTCSGNMQSCMFVDRDNNGIVLPSSKSSDLHNGDFNSFCRVVEKILDIEESKVDFHSDSRYPYDLRSLLDYNRGYGISDYWLFSHPIFWNSSKRVSFILGVDNLRARDPFFAVLLEQAMYMFPERQIKEYSVAWKKRIPFSSKLFRVLTYADGDPLQLQPQSQLQSPTSASLYSQPVGITRFARNCLMNMSNTFDENDKELRRIFPHYHTWVYDSILKIKILPTTAVSGSKYDSWTGPSKSGIFF